MSIGPGEDPGPGCRMECGRILILIEQAVPIGFTKRIEKRALDPLIFCAFGWMRPWSGKRMPRDEVILIQDLQQLPAQQTSPGLCHGMERSVTFRRDGLSDVKGDAVNLLLG